MKRREFITMLGGVVTWPSTVRAQQGERMRRIGFLLGGSPSDAMRQAWLAAFRRGLQERGWPEGKNIRIDYRWSGTETGAFRAWAADLVGKAPDVLVSNTSPGVAALQKATQTIPIVFINTSDPVSQGFVTSLARPGGNLTGFTNFEYSISGKWLQILKEVSPTIERVGVLWNPENDPSGLRYMEAVRTAASAIGTQLSGLTVRNVDEINRSIDDFARNGVHSGLVVFPGPAISGNRESIISRVAMHRLPAMYSDRYFATNGGLMSYGIDIAELHRQAGEYVDRILWGTKPADLPVQQPTKFEFVINLKTAKALGLDVPPTLLARADEVIE
jgi:ABC-type uncharacterized transport system substrate-binding protein